MQFFKTTALAVAVCAATGVIGDAVASGVANYFAVIVKTGDTKRGSGVESSARIAGGKYEVLFSREVADCALVASVNDAHGGSASARAKAANPNLIVVNTFAANGAPANRAFTVMVSCAP
jgi:hypothetical protein